MRPGCGQTITRLLAVCVERLADRTDGFPGSHNSLRDYVDRLRTESLDVLRGITRTLFGCERDDGPRLFQTGDRIVDIIVPAARIDNPLVLMIRRCHCLEIGRTINLRRFVDPRRSSGGFGIGHTTLPFVVIARPNMPRLLRPDYGTDK